MDAPRARDLCRRRRARGGRRGARQQRPARRPLPPGDRVGRAHLPAGPACPRAESGPGWLRRQTEAGLARRYGRDAAGVRAARARLDEELAIIERLGFTDYFLLVAEIVAFARAQGIPTVGRGSGASSIVSYVLGITNVDPLRHGLCFERFLHPQRRDCPDLDIDLCWQRRDEVIAHVYETYGRDRVAMISTHATLGARSAFRETAKALGVANARVNALAKRIPRDLEAPYLEKLERLPDARFIAWREPPLAEALRLAERLDGAPRHLSVHCGGIVIADRPLTYYVPLERAAKDVVVTQFEMRAIERIGLVKMDLLGNRALSTIGECVTLVKRGLPPGAPPPAVLDPDLVPEDDPATAARVAAGDTLNCFQLESPAMRHLLRMLRARTLEETIAAVALVRPGPAESGMKEAFCRRHRGLEPAAFHHPDLVPVLDATHGVMLYEEDVMRVAAALAGLSLAEGDDLRRALAAARDDEEFRSLERGFVAACARRGVAAETARAVWRDLARFAAYAFCKAHAAGYGALGWQSAYFKTHFPTEWAVGILNHHAGMYATWVHVEDLRRRRRRVPRALREPLGVGDDAGGDGRAGAHGARRPRRARAGVRARRARPASASWRRGPSAPSARSPTSWTACAPRCRNWSRSSSPARSTSPGRTRPSLLLEARVGASPTRRPRCRRAARPRSSRPTARLLAPEPVSPVAAPDLPEFDLAERVRGECRATGLWFSAHPLDVFVDARASQGTVPAARGPRPRGPAHRARGDAVRLPPGRDEERRHDAVPDARRPERARRVRALPRRVPRARAGRARPGRARRGPRGRDAGRGHARGGARRRAGVGSPGRRRASDAAPGRRP